METNPTPRPWKVIADLAGCSTIIDEKGYEIASHIDLANAELIGDAVNERDALLSSHAKLLEICKESKSWHEIEKGMEPIYWNGFKNFERRLEQIITEAEKIQGGKEESETGFSNTALGEATESKKEKEREND